MTDMPHFSTETENAPQGTRFQLGTIVLLPCLFNSNRGKSRFSLQDIFKDTPSPICESEALPAWSTRESQQVGSLKVAACNPL